MSALETIQTALEVGAYSVGGLGLAAIGFKTCVVDIPPGCVGVVHVKHKGKLYEKLRKDKSPKTGWILRNPITDLVTPIRTGYQEYDISDTGRSGRSLTLTLTDIDGMPTQGWEVDARLGWGIRPDRASLIVQHLTPDEDNMPDHGMDYRELLDSQMAIIGSSARFDAITGLDADTVLSPDGRELIANRANDIMSASLADAPWGEAVILGRMRFGQFVQPEERAERIERVRRMEILRQERDTVGSYLVDMEMAKSTRNVTLIRMGEMPNGGYRNGNRHGQPVDLTPDEIATAISQLSLNEETKVLLLSQLKQPAE